jgi:RNA polymerase sigma-70 factor, ECF subfamily
MARGLHVAASQFDEVDSYGLGAAPLRPRRPRTTRRATEMDDQQLMTSIRGVDREHVVRELLARHGSAVYGLALRLLRDAVRAEDVAQDVFVRLWSDPNRFDPARGALRGYLLRETHGRAVDRIRSDVRRSDREHRHLREHLPLWSAAHGGRGDVDRRIAVRAALRILTPAEREIISLAYFEGRTYRQVAIALGQPEGTVKSRIRRSLNTLAAGLDLLD